MALKRNYEKIEFVNFQKKETVYSGLANRSKSARGKGNHIMCTMAGAPSGPDVLSLQNPKPAQRPQIDTSKTIALCERRSQCLRWRAGKNPMIELVVLKTNF